MNETPNKMREDTHNEAGVVVATRTLGGKLAVALAPSNKEGVIFVPTTCWWGCC